MAERVLTTRELQRAVLARQGLLHPFGGPPVKVLERVGGLQAQYAPSMYVGLLARMRELERDVVTRLLERRAAIQATLMRVTIHLVARGDYWPFALAVREARRPLWLRSSPGVEAAAMEVAAARVRERLTEGPAPRRELEALVGRREAAGAGLWVDLVRVPPSGTWERRRADLYGLAEDWVGPPPEGLGAGRAVEHLVRRYLTGFGPASRKDVQSYTGLSQAVLAPALHAVVARRFRSEDGEELLDVARAPLPDADTPAPVRFLPTWDATLLAHARRTRILPEEHRAKVFRVRKPQSVSTVLVDGVVIGTWRWTGTRVEVEPFGRLDAADRRAVDAEAERVAAFHA